MMEALISLEFKGSFYNAASPYSQNSNLVVVRYFALLQSVQTGSEAHQHPMQFVSSLLAWRKVIRA
jgi:hypothetical protein